MLKLVLILFIAPMFYALEGEYYRQREGYLLIGRGGSNPDCVDSGRVLTHIGCAVLCASDSACVSINYRETDRCCVLHTKQFYDFGVEYEENPLWTYYGPDETKVSNDEWTLVFKAVSGTGTIIWNAWSDDDVSHDLDLPNQHPGSFSKHTVSSSYPFYRSHLLDVWSTAGIKEVKFGLYENGMEVAFMTFNGTGSTRDDWFSHPRLLLKTWSDLSLYTPVIFSLEGDRHRKFYITAASSLNNCDNFGWLIVLNRQANICEFDKEAPPPQFLYSKGNGGNYFKYKVYGLAQVLAVFVKF